MNIKNYCKEKFQIIYQLINLKIQEKAKCWKISFKNIKIKY